jgi:hypothetical protein
MKNALNDATSDEKFHGKILKSATRNISDNFSNNGMKFLVRGKIGYLSPPEPHCADPQVVTSTRRICTKKQMPQI